MMVFRFPALALSAALILGGCAVQEETPANQDEKTYIDAWLLTHYPDAVRSGISTYILSDTPGDGSGLIIPGYAMVTYTVTDLEGNITSTSDSLKAKQTGEFDKSYYYGPRVWNVSEGTLNKGLEDMISGMVTGGTRTALIPGWTQTYNRYETEEEYMKRKNEAIRHCQLLGLDFVDADYQHKTWLNEICGLENEPERGARCLKCFEIRLQAAAHYAATHGFQVFATTLSTSRWKNLAQINAAGEKAMSDNEGTIFWGANWRKGGLQNRRSELIAQYGFYNQTYCGCEFSMQHTKDKKS